MDEGWLCKRCGRVNSPRVLACPCHSIYGYPDLDKIYTGKQPLNEVPNNYLSDGTGDNPKELYPYSTIEE